MKKHPAPSVEWCFHFGRSIAFHRDPPCLIPPFAWGILILLKKRCFIYSNFFILVRGTGSTTALSFKGIHANPRGKRRRPSKTIETLITPTPCWNQNTCVTLPIPALILSVFPIFRVLNYKNAVFFADVFDPSATVKPHPMGNPRMGHSMLLSFHRYTASFDLKPDDWNAPGVG